MNRLLILTTLSLLLGSLHAFINVADIECGQQKLVQNRMRIVNGVESYVGEFPWMVSLKLRGSHFCGGALIDKHWIVTAAHCVHDRSASQFMVSVAEHNVKGDSSHQKRSVIGVERIVLHPAYAPVQKLNDIALLRLKEAVVWNEYVQPVCLPDFKSNSFAGMNGIVTGWGKTDELGFGMSDVLMKVNVPILDNGECQQWYRDSKKLVKIVDSAICAGIEQGGKDACQGDSGGPLTVERDARHLLVGVVSAGVGCARPKLPGIYSRVSSHLDWILQVVQ